MSTVAFEAGVVSPAWNAFQNALPVKVVAIHGKRHYERMVAFMNGLLDVVGDNEKHELAELLDLVGQLVEDYENAHEAIPDSPPHTVLRLLMDQHGLQQSDLSKEIGGQSVVSDILRR